LELSLTTTRGSKPQLLRPLRNRLTCDLSLRLTRAKPTGRSLMGSVASSRVKRPRWISSTHRVPENLAMTICRCAGRSRRLICQRRQS